MRTNPPHNKSEAEQNLFPYTHKIWSYQKKTFYNFPSDVQ